MPINVNKPMKRFESMPQAIDRKKRGKIYFKFNG